MRWQIQGANRITGEEVTEFFSAKSQEEAIAKANRANLFISDIQFSPPVYRKYIIATVIIIIFASGLIAYRILSRVKPHVVVIVTQPQISQFKLTYKLVIEDKE